MQNTITITPTALKHLQENLAQSPAGTIGIHFGLRDAGCSGFAYTIDFTDKQKPDAHIFDFDGVKIIIDANDFKALRGSEIDFVHEGINSILEVRNPNVVHECGCGESFQFKDDEELE